MKAWSPTDAGGQTTALAQWEPTEVDRTKFLAGQAALQDPAAANLKGYDQTVVDPETGKAYTVDASYLPQLQAKGWRLDTPEEAAHRKWVEANKGLAGAAKAAFLEFGDALTFGAYKPIIGAVAKSGLTIGGQQFDPYALAHWEALKHEHAAAATLGTVAGFGAQMVALPGVLGAVGKLGGAAEGAVLGTKGAQAGELALKGATGAEMAYRTAAAGGTLAEAAAASSAVPGFLRTVGAGAARMAVEGGALAAPKAMTEAILGDPDRAAETFLHGVALGGVFGAGFGAVGYLGKKSAGGIASKVFAKGEQEGGELAAAEAEKAFQPGVDGPKGWVGRKVEEAADMQAFRAMANNHASLKKIIKSDGIKAADVGRFVREQGLVRRIGEGAEDYAQRISGFVDATGAEVGAFWKQPALEGKAFDTAKASTRIDGLLAELRTNPAYRPLADSLENQWVHDFKVLADANGGKLDFAVAHQWRAGLDDIAYREARSMGPLVKELREVRRIFNSELVSQAESAAKEASPGFLKDLQALNRKYRYGTAIKGGTDDYVGREATNRVLSPTDNLWGAAAAAGGAAIGGGPAAMLAGAAGAIAHHVVRTEGNAVAAAALDGIATGRGLRVLENSFAGHFTRLQRIPAALQAMGEGRRLPAEAREAAGVSVIQRLLTADDAPTRIESPKDSVRFADGLAKLANNPPEMSARLEVMTGAISKDAPDVAQAAALKASQISQYIMAARPTSPDVMSPFAREVWKPSEMQMAEFHAKVKTALDPYEAIRALEDKTLNPAHMDALQATAPKLYQEFVRRVADFATTPEAAPIPYAYRLKLSMLIGAPLDRSVANLMGYQDVFSQPDLAKQAEKAALKPPGDDALGDVARVSG